MADADKNDPNVLTQYIDNFDVGRGAQNDFVLEVQQLLDSLFGANLDTDGVYGPLTEEAVREFQQANGITVDGYVGPQTSKALQDPSSNPIGGVPGSMPVVLSATSKSHAITVAGGIGAVVGGAIAAVGAKKHKKALLIVGGLVALAGGGTAAYGALRKG